MTRSCGDCRACCTALQIDGLEAEKPAGQVCPNGGAPCAAYATRPSACGAYACEWLREERMPRSWRPDRSGIILDRIEPDPATAAGKLDAQGVPWLNVREARPGAFAARSARAVLSAAHATGAVLIAHPWRNA